MIGFIFIILLLYNIKLSAGTGREDIKQTRGDSAAVSHDWELFYREHAFKKLFLVFAGPYPASPTSSFGHIFVLLEPVKDRPLLLWDALDFSADITNTGPFDFFLKGIFGSLEGHYKNVLFYEKLREYTFIESRSLWLFPVQLDDRETKSFLQRFFNLRKSIHPYRFSNKNCASEIYYLIRSSIDDSYRQENSLVFPHTIINGLKDRIKEPLFIESTYNLLMDKAEKSVLNSSSSGSNDSEDSTANQAVLLSTMEWKYAKDDEHLSPEEITRLQDLRKKVSLPGSREFSSFKSYPKKFDIHPTMLAGSGIRIKGRERAEYLLTYRFGIHEYFENCDVYPESDFLSLLRFELGIEAHKIRINQLMLFDQTSLQPASFISKYFSWKLGFGIIRKDEFPDPQSAAGIFAGFGYSLALIRNRVRLSLLMNAEPVYLKNSGFCLLTGPELITSWNISGGIKWRNTLKGTFKNPASPEVHYLMVNDLGITISERIILLLSSKLNEDASFYDMKLNFYIN